MVVAVGFSRTASTGLVSSQPMLITLLSNHEELHAIIQQHKPSHSSYHSHVSLQQTAVSAPSSLSFSSCRSSWAIIFFVKPFLSPPRLGEVPAKATALQSSRGCHSHCILERPSSFSNSSLCLCALSILFCSAACSLPKGWLLWGFEAEPFSACLT